MATELGRTHRVLTYDRRGHSRSERPSVQGSRRSDEDDRAALLDELDHAPAHLVANSYGASIALGLAARRPELVRSVAAHEPPLLPAAPSATSFDEAGDVLPLYARRTTVANAETFLETLADPSWAEPPNDVSAAVPVLLTDGQASPAWLRSIVEMLATATYRHASRRTFSHGAGHTPHLTHRGVYVDVVRSFIAATSVAASRPFVLENRN